MTECVLSYARGMGFLAGLTSYPCSYHVAPVTCVRDVTLTVPQLTPDDIKYLNDCQCLTLPLRH
jgi:hypothetical protein